MTAGSEALVLKVTADTGQVAAGLAPMTKALDQLGDEADAAAKDLRELSNTDVKLSVKDQALQRARDRIDELRNDIARDVVLGVDTKAAQREISNLQTAMRRLEDNPPRIEPEVDTSKLDMADELEGIDSLREGAMQLGDAMGNLDGSFASVANVVRETVPALADANQTLIAMRLRAEAAGGSLGRISTAASRITSVVAGPWGLAIAAGAGLLAAWASNSESASDATDDFTDAINYQAGALDKANRAAAAKSLEDKHLLETAEAMGISTQDMVSALAGSRDAYERVTDAIGQYNLRMQANRTASDTAKEAADDFTHTFFGMTVKMFGARDESERLERAIGDIGTAADKSRYVIGRMSDGLTHNADLWADYGVQVDEARKSLDDIVGSIDALNGRFASAREATIGYEKALDDANAAIKENGQAVTKNHKAFDTASEKGRENEQTLIALAKASESMTEARLRDAEASGESTADIMDDYKRQRVSLYETARRMGLNETAATEYVDALLDTPEDVATRIQLKGYEDAKNKLAGLTKDQDVTIDVHLNYDKYIKALRQGRRQALLELGTIDIGSTGYAPPPSAPPAATPHAGLTLLQPRIYLDGRPIRAALHGDVSAAVATSAAAAAAPRRVR